MANPNDERRSSRLAGGPDVVYTPTIVFPSANAFPTALTGCYHLFDVPYVHCFEMSVHQVQIM